MAQVEGSSEPCFSIPWSIGTGEVGATMGKKDKSYLT